MTRSVLIKADASSRIGNGHIMRCAVLAEALIAEGFRVEFVCRELPGHRCDWLEEKGFRVWRLPNPASPLHFEYGDCRSWTGVAPADDAAETCALLGGNVYSWVVVDHYAFDAPQHKALAVLGTRMMVIDDLANRSYYADLFLDTTLNRTQSHYAGMLPEFCATLFGTGYALLRSEFAALRGAAIWRRRHYRAVEKLLISCGATDPTNTTLQILQALENFEYSRSWRISVVLAGNAPHLSSVQGYCESHSHVHLMVDVADMAALLAEHDLCIGAAGSSAWERACMGLPSVVLVTGVDQAANVAALLSRGAIVRGTPEGVLGEALEQSFFLHQLRALCTNRVMYQEISQASFDLCDGQGARRVVQAMCREFN